MKILIGPGKSKEVLSPFDNKWYTRGREYDVPFSVAIRMQADPQFGVTIPYQSAPEYDASIWRDRKEVAMFAEIDPNSGWGNVGTNLIKYSPDINFAQVGKIWGVREPLVRTASHRAVNEGGGMVFHQQPKSTWLLSPFGRNIAIVPFETTKVPYSWVERLNFMDAVFVPCLQNVEMMRDSGVTVPIEIVHWGVDTEKFYKLERQGNRPFTFGHMGMLSMRKGTDILVRAFQAAFPYEKDVRLICKTSDRNYPFMVFGEKRIVVQQGPMEHQDLMDKFFSEIDVFVFPTKGEGCGLTPLEAMATGVPAIVTGWSGPVEYMNEDAGWSLNYSMGKAKEFDVNVYGEDCGDWAIPDFDHLVYLMRYAYEHQDEVKQKGDYAAEYVKREWSWDAQIPLFHEALDKHL